MEVIYKTKNASFADIYCHLKSCNDDFIPPLDSKVNLEEYAKKIFTNGVTFEAWSENILVGLVAAYFNDPEKNIGYITDVSLVKKYTGRGIAKELLKICINHAADNNFRDIELEVNGDNEPAINLYKKFGFTVSAEKNKSLFMKFTVGKK